MFLKPIIYWIWKVLKLREIAPYSLYISPSIVQPIIHLKSCNFYENSLKTRKLIFLLLFKQFSHVVFFLLFSFWKNAIFPRRNWIEETDELKEWFIFCGHFQEREKRMPWWFIDKSYFRCSSFKYPWAFEIETLYYETNKLLVGTKQKSPHKWIKLKLNNIFVLFCRI